MMSFHLLRMLTEIEPDDWSDSDEEDEAQTSQAPQDLAAATRRMQALQRKLQQAKHDLVYYRQFVSERLNLAGLADELKKPDSLSTQVAVPLRDDDSHYFQSYAENGMFRQRWMRPLVTDNIQTSIPS